MKTKELKRDEAIERQNAYDSLSTEQKLAMLDSKFGKGIGAKKERAKLAKLMAKKAKK